MRKGGDSTDPFGDDFQFTGFGVFALVGARDQRVRSHVPAKHLRRPIQRISVQLGVKLDHKLGHRSGEDLFFFKSTQERLCQTKARSINFWRNLTEMSETRSSRQYSVNLGFTWPNLVELET